jgi:hypothetical protein
MHSILHDWPDSKCREILQSITPAMKMGYSKILINENVIPDKNAHWLSTGLDIFMMAVFSASERTAGQWKALAESVGLRIVRIWEYERVAEGLIEMELE